MTDAGDGHLRRITPYHGTSHLMRLNEFVLRRDVSRGAAQRSSARPRGLYLPQTILTVSADELARFAHSSYADIARTVTRKFLHSEIPDAELRAIVDDVRISGPRWNMSSPGSMYHAPDQADGLV